jgi:methionine synthase II (cobalamin-independent)
MYSSSIVIIQVDYTILQELPKLAVYMKQRSSYFKLYNKEVLCLISLQIFQKDFQKYLETSGNYNLDIQVLTLNSFAKNRMVLNFEKDYPELALRVMSCDDKSLMVKIRRTDKC